MNDAEILARLYNNCDPLKPATDVFYIDCTDVRGGEVFAEQLCSELSQTTGRIHTLFTGHMGCGKSSELQHLTMKLAHKSPLPGRKRFLAIVVDMLEYVDEYDVTATEILLAVISEVAEQLREVEKIELKDSYFLKRWAEIKDFFLSDIEIKEGEISPPFAKIKVSRLRTSQSTRQKVREKLFPNTADFLTEVNSVFREVRLRIKETPPRDGGQSYSDFVVILDNLEKIQRLADGKEGEASRKALFIENAPLFLGMDAHVVYTIPLSLVRASSGELSVIYGRMPFVLPMVKTEERGSHVSYPKGRDKLTQLLALRAGTDVALVDVFTEDALEFLIRYSGGHIRNLLMFARQSTLYANGTLPIGLKAAQRAIGQTISVLSASLQPEDWEKLAVLELSKTQTWNNNNPHEQHLLEMLCVMEYINGGDEDIFNEPVPWYAVNPILRELNLFKLSIAALRGSA